MLGRFGHHRTLLRAVSYGCTSSEWCTTIRLNGRCFADAPAASSSGTATSTASKPAASDSKPAASDSKPASSQESTSSTTSSSKPAFTGASASDSYAGVAHAGFEVGSEGRFGYSRKYAAGWDRIFGKKREAATAADGPAMSGSIAGGGATTSPGLAAALAKDTVLAEDLKAAVGKLSQAELSALAEVLQAR
mmetsp:Transcript_73289/g.214895  ORF Transcript_73289/g.214895 Transcript_73289/m.214895 type:complete len:192 (-) Transcript_73289:152-727(-)